MAEGRSGERAALCRRAVLGALLLTATTAAGAPGKSNVCVDAATCRSAAPADALRQLVLLPTPARMTTGEDGKTVWTIPVLGWIYTPISTARSECAGTLAALTREALSVLDRPAAVPAAGPAGAPPRTGRLPRFFVDNLCNQRVKISVGSFAGPSALPQSLQPAADDPFCRSLLLFPDETPPPKLTPVTDAGGLFCGTVTLSPEQVQALSPQGQPLRLQAELVDPRSGDSAARDDAEAFLLRDVDTEVSIISDIDDTVRISHVGFKPALLQGTFFEPFRATPGLAQLYSRWQQHSPGLALHFISSSPLPLYKPRRHSSDLPCYNFEYLLHMTPDRSKLLSLHKLQE